MKASAKALAKARAVLPSQNQLFALFLHLCGRYHVKKPNKAILALLEEDEFSRTVRRHIEARELDLAVEDVPNEPGEDSEEAKERRATVVPLSAMRTLPFRNGEALQFGTVGVLILLELLAECPLLEELDLSVFGDLFAVDPYKQCPSGNEVLRAVCNWAQRQPNLRVLNIQKQQIGTLPATWLLETVKKNPSVKSVLWEEEGVDIVVNKQLHVAVSANVQGKNKSLPPPFPTSLSSSIQQLAEVDRKSGRQRQSLHLLLWEREAAFGSLSMEERELIVMKAKFLTLSECTAMCRGLRGDEVHLFLIESGEALVQLGTQSVTLRRGDYFGEPLEAVMFSAGTVTATQRGTAFAIPFSVCEKLFHAWERNVELFLDLLRKTVIFQPLPMWVLIRACHEATEVVHTAGSEVIARGDSFNGLHIVSSGIFSCERTRFGKGDFFGEEPLISRHKVATAAISALKTEGQATTVRIASFVASNHIISPLKEVFRVNTREYEAPVDTM